MIDALTNSGAEWCVFRRNARRSPRSLLCHIMTVPSVKNARQIRLCRPLGALDVVGWEGCTHPRKPAAANPQQRMMNAEEFAYTAPSVYEQRHEFRWLKWRKAKVCMHWVWLMFWIFLGRHSFNQC